MFPSEKDIAQSAARTLTVDAMGAAGAAEHPVGHRPSGVTMRVARISRGLACGIGAILLIGASGIVAVGMLLGERDGRPAAPVPEAAAARSEGESRQLR